MPKAAIFFCIILFSSTLTNSYAFPTGDLVFQEDSQTPLIFDSELIDIDSEFFTENNYKRYLIFGTNPNYIDFLKKNSIYGIQSNGGFFYVSVLSEKSASNLALQGFHVIEDSKLDFHLSDNPIQDVSRIG